MKKGVFAIICILIFTQCNRETVNIPTTKINFDNLAVGQKSLYVTWESKNIWADNITFKQTTDSISLTIISKETDGFKVEEKRLNKPELPAYYFFKIKEDSLYVHSLSTTSLSSSSSVFFNVGALQYPLKDSNLPTLNTNQWATPKAVDIDMNISQLFAKIGNFKIMGKDYDSAFVYFDRSTTPFDGPTITKIYTKKDGFISFQPIGGKTTFGRIYNLVP
jgi:hypothetical protein